MSTTKFRRFSFLFVLPTPKGKSVRRMEMFEHVKGFIGNIALLQKSEAMMKKTTMDFQQDGLGFWVDSRPDFNLGCVVLKESEMLLANEVMNEVCTRLNEANWEEKHHIDMFCIASFILESKNDIFSSFIRKDAWDKLFKKEENYKPRRLEIWQPPSKDKIRRGFTIATGKKGNMIEFTLSNMFENAFPIDAVSKAMSAVNETKKTYLMKLIGRE